MKRFKRRSQDYRILMPVTTQNIRQNNGPFTPNHLGPPSGLVDKIFAINCLVLALVAGINPTLPRSSHHDSQRMAMYTITSFSPTPGQHRVAEYLFGGFLAIIFLLV
ncbi:MAG: hypothetical protein IPJ13_00135 [Saprospiraceae bacterium]|nr:hypothetical protein [Saprospiraceae bacterium]